METNIRILLCLIYDSIINTEPSETSFAMTLCQCVGGLSDFTHTQNETPKQKAPTHSSGSASNAKYWSVTLMLEQHRTQLSCHKFELWPELWKEEKDAGRRERGCLKLMETESCLQQNQHLSDHLQLWFLRYESPTGIKLLSALTITVHVCMWVSQWSAALNCIYYSKKAGRMSAVVVVLFFLVCVRVWDWARSGEKMNACMHCICKCMCTGTFAI